MPSEAAARREGSTEQPQNVHMTSETSTLPSPSSGVPDGKQNSSDGSNEKQGSSHGPDGKQSSLDGDVAPPLPEESRYSYFRIILGATGVGVAGTFLYFLHLADYNPGRAEQLLSDRVAKLFSKEPVRSESEVNSQFIVSLDPSTQVQMAAYFIQLDLDKETGVRRSDILELLPELGFSVDSAVVKNFLAKGRGRTAERKRLSGCSMQEFAEVMEGLILEEIAAPSISADEPPAESKMAKPSNTPKGDSNSGSSEMMRVEDRVATKLREKNKVVSKLSFPPLAFPIVNAPRHQISSQNEEDAPSDDEVTELDIARLSKLKKELQLLHQRSGLSVAQASRLMDINRELKALEGSRGNESPSAIFFSSRI